MYVIQMLVKAPCGMKESALRWLVKNIASGVEHLHNMHVTHRDIKPENIVIQQRGPDEKDVCRTITLCVYSHSESLPVRELCTGSKHH